MAAKALLEIRILKCLYLQKEKVSEAQIFPGLYLKYLYFIDHVNCYI